MDRDSWSGILLVFFYFDVQNQASPEQFVQLLSRILLTGFYLSQNLCNETSHFCTSNRGFQDNRQFLIVFLLLVFCQFLVSCFSRVVGLTVSKKCSTQDFLFGQKALWKSVVDCPIIFTSTRTKKMQCDPISHLLCLFFSNFLKILNCYW